MADRPGRNELRDGFKASRAIAAEQGGWKAPFPIVWDESDSFATRPAGLH
jgi:hypothetical protein